jgi:hypothetical protein
VDLRDLEPGVQRAFGRQFERRHDVAHVVAVHRPRRRRVVVLVGIWTGGSDRLPAALVWLERIGTVCGTGLARLPARVGELDPRDAALVADELGDGSERVGVVVAPDAEVLRRDAPVRLDGGGLGHHETGATDGAASEVYAVPLGREAVLVLTGVLTHRRHGHAVRYLRPAQRQRRKQVVAHCRRLAVSGGKPARSGPGLPGPRPSIPHGDAVAESARGQTVRSHC